MHGVALRQFMFDLSSGASVWQLRKRETVPVADLEPFELACPPELIFLKGRPPYSASVIENLNVADLPRPPHSLGRRLTAALGRTDESVAGQDVYTFIDFATTI